MSNVDKIALAVVLIFLALPGFVIGLMRGPQPSVSGLLGGLLAALLVGGFLFVAPQMAIEELFQRPDFNALMRQAFPEDFFGGKLTLPIYAAILSGALVPLAFAATWAIGLPRWLGLLVLPVFLALSYLALAYQNAQNHSAASQILRMTIEFAAAAIGIVIWEVYFLIMGWLAHSLRPDLARQ